MNVPSTGIDPIIIVFFIYGLAFETVVDVVVILLVVPLLRPLVART